MVQRQFALRLVRETFDGVLRRGQIPVLPAVIPEEYQRAESGVYVAAFENPGHKPRGRVGSHLPTRSTLAEDIRFQAGALVGTYPFRRQDLPHLVFEVLLTKSPQFLPDLSSLKADRGLLVRSGTGKHGVSLPKPQVRDARERFVEACERAGIVADTGDLRLYEFGIDTLTE